MQLSDNGLRLIKGFEAYMRKLPDGNCVAYRCVIGRDKSGKPIHDGKWTIGWGCTEGVKEGDVWTPEQAENALRKEIAKHEAAINQLVTVPLNANEFDACVSLSYNIGTGIGATKGGFKNSSILAKINAGDMVGAARIFPQYNKSQGIVVPGLISRRAREQALFLKPVEAPPEPAMPQTVDTPPETPEASRINAAASRQQVDKVIGGTAGGSIPVTPAPTTDQPIPGPIPPGTRQSVDNVMSDLSWAKATFGTMMDLASFVGAKWWFIAGGIALYFFARSFWDSQRIKAFRAEDHANGYTVK